LVNRKSCCGGLTTSKNQDVAYKNSLKGAKSERLADLIQIIDAAAAADYCAA
jgi:hypothetical protein